MIESELKDIPGVAAVSPSLHRHETKITGEFGEQTPDALAVLCTQKLAKHGYQFSLARVTHDSRWREFTTAVPLALLFLALFFLLQKLGIVNLLRVSEVTTGTAFVLGLIASVSTCMAVVGGLTLSLGATYAKEGVSPGVTRRSFGPHLLFHAGRLVAFFLLGGVLGSLGSVLQLGPGAMFVIGLVVGIVMLLLGINLLDTFHGLKRLQPTMPKWIAKHAYGVTKFNHTVMPLFAGVATFFLPCGFTQAMQFQALATGSFSAGALLLSAFALGTLPVLALLSFSSYRIQGMKHTGVFFKTAGLVVIAFALINIFTSFVVAGFLPPLPFF